jgi:hypothetical protein
MKRPLARFTCVVVLCALMIPAADAAGSGTSGPPVSAISQYVEMVPTSSGPRPRGSASHTQLSQKSTQRIRKLAPTEASTLVAIATDSSLGAPPTATTPHRTTQTTTQTKKKATLGEHAPRATSTQPTQASSVHLYAGLDFASFARVLALALAIILGSAIIALAGRQGSHRQSVDAR